MEGIVCDRCGEGLLIESDVRYVMTLEIQAAYDPLEITKQDLERDLRGEIDDVIRQLETTDPEEAQNQVHYRARFDLCPPCRRAVMANPLSGTRSE